MKLFISTISCLLFYCCLDTGNNIEFVNQSELIKKYRADGFLEYSSRLNDSLLLILSDHKKTLLTKNTYDAILEVSENLKFSKPVLKCYQLQWKENPYDPSAKILLEWNPSSGVIFRIFTTSETLISKFPEQSL